MRYRGWFGLMTVGVKVLMAVMLVHMEMHFADG
jgi:hypothetical protein